MDVMGTFRVMMLLTLRKHLLTEYPFLELTLDEATELALLRLSARRVCRGLHVDDLCGPTCLPGGRRVLQLVFRTVTISPVPVSDQLLQSELQAGRGRRRLVVPAAISFRPCWCIRIRIGRTGDGDWLQR